MTTLTLPEELLLLALDDTKGSVSANASAALEYALAGAQLMELALAGRLSLEDVTVVVVDQASVGDVLLDAVLGRIAASAKPRKPRYWVDKLHPRIKRSYLDRLEARGVIVVETHKVLGLVPVTRHPEMDPEPEREIRARLRRVLVDGEPTDARTMCLVVLVAACNLQRSLFPDRADRKEVKPRIKQISEGDAIGSAVKAIVTEINAAVTAAIVVATMSSS